MQKTTSELSKENEFLKRQLLETQSLSRIGSWNWNVATGEVHWSDMMFLLLGYQPNSVVPSYHAALRHVYEEDQPLYEETLEKCLTEKSGYYLENRIVQVDNTVIRVISRGTCYLDKSGEVLRMIGTVQDITEQLQAEELLRIKEKAEENDRLKSKLLANISHEIRTPLNAILGFSQLLKNPDLSRESLETYIDIINSSGTQLKAIISNILELSKIEANQVSITYSRCNLNKIMDELRIQFKNSFPDKSIALNLRKSLPDDMSIIHTDGNRLIQILSNLLENAQKFTQKGSIDFGYEIHGEFIFFTVTDTGIGIPAEDHQNIFKRFSTLNNPAHIQGTGLGLSIVKELVTLLGGEVSVSSAPGQGASFTFTIPYHPLRIKEIEQHPHPQLRFNLNSTILIVEDNTLNFKYLDIILKEKGYETLHARNGKEAVHYFNKGKSIDLVIMDLRMPVMDGIEATQLIRKINPTIPIIMQSGDVLDPIVGRAFAVGCNAFVPKPFSEEELFGIIEKQLKLTSTNK